ncbi:uncharacterized protein (DUF433 family) [Chitinophaga polysaccharea]|uniref:Uncharacterized protein (DUF433 family) n=1 Tax=Chitinophaga polysaccharea TaxID=1293035 RepID=A0A561Q2T4_9BACT|nr:uncharacterized protein (DUF433 family) [Chitinophaga polysaccharea]
MDITQYIDINPKVMLGKPVIKGTRITIESILERLSNGETVQDILVAYPHITPEAINVIRYGNVSYCLLLSSNGD